MMRFLLVSVISFLCAGCDVPVSTRMVGVGIYEDLISTIYYKTMNYNLQDYYPETTKYCVESKDNSECKPIKALYKWDDQGIKLTFAYKNQTGIESFERAIDGFLIDPVNRYDEYRVKFVDVVDAKLNNGKVYSDLSLKIYTGYGTQSKDLHNQTVRSLLSKLKGSSYKIEDRNGYKLFSVVR